jgi:predicted SAM-dependent methyltransferase
MMGKKLHLGCGTRHLEGYLNIDIREEVKPDLVADITNLQALGLENVSEIYACHVIEHLENPGAVLQSWADVLEYHGVLRLSVPDLFNIFDAYNAGVHLSRLKGLIWGRQDYTGNAHLHGWDFETLADLLRECGYFNAHRWWPRREFPHGYHDFSYALIHTNETEVYHMSLNIMGWKI